MKKEQLLDAIGGIDETILIEAEKPVANGKRLTSRILIAAAVICALAVTVAASGLLSKPIRDSEIVTGETVFPFYMDAEGNIVPEGKGGLKVTMEVDVNPDAPDWIEKLYVLEPGARWKYAGGGSSGDRYYFATMDTVWRQEGKPGELRLGQSVIEFYANDVYGENCADTLPGLSEKDGVTAKTMIIGDFEVLRVSIPELPNYTGTKYCTGGETRLYWTDGDYMLHLDYPYWVTDAQAEAMLESITVKDFVTPVPEDYGKINPQAIAERLPDLTIGKDNGTTCANNTMGLGYAAYGDGCIYLAGIENGIYRYDLATGELEEMLFANERAVAGHLLITDQYILYTDVWSDLFAMKKDGSTEKPVYQGIGSAQLYAEGMTLYTTQGILDLSTGKIQNWPEGVHSYCVDDNYIYAVREGGKKVFLRAPKGTMDFEEIEIGFYPIKILAHGEDLYMAEGIAGKWNVIRYRSGEEQRLPVNAVEYQILGDKLIYRDEDSAGRVLKSYDLNTGVTETLCEKIFTFSILEERYICVFCAEGTESWYTLIDTQTDTTTRIEIPTNG